MILLQFGLYVLASLKSLSFPLDLYTICFLKLTCANTARASFKYWCQGHEGAPHSLIYRWSFLHGSLLAAGHKILFSTCAD